MYSSEPRTSAKENFPPNGDGAKPSSTTLCDFDGALVRLGGDRRLLIELMRIYIEDAPLLLLRIANGLREANCSDVLHAAHLLEGLALNLGAPSVSLPAQQLEDLAIAGRLEEAPAAVEQLQIEAARLEQALHSYC